MKKFIYPLAAVAALFTGNLYAQDAISTVDKKGDSKYDCVTTVTQDNRTLDFEGTVVTQEFTACTTGDLGQVVVKVKGASENATYSAELVDNRGAVLDAVDFDKRDVKDGYLALQLGATLQEGKTYSLQITAPQNKALALRYKLGAMGTLTKDGAPVRGKLTATFGIKNNDSQIVDGSASRGQEADKPGTRGLSNQCKVAVNGHNERIRLERHGHGVSQKFTSCSYGVLQQVSFKVQASFEDFQGQFKVMDANGENLHSQRINSRNITNGLLTLPLNIVVEEGEQLQLAIRALNDTRISFHGNSNAYVGECKRNGSEAPNMEFTAYIKEVEKQDETLSRSAAKTEVTTYPNPFSDRISVRLENAKEGTAVVQLLDFSGNVLRSDVIEVKDASEEISFDTNSISRSGYYALRIIQGDNVKNVTVMKR